MFFAVTTDGDALLIETPDEKCTEWLQSLKDLSVISALVANRQMCEYESLQQYKLMSDDFFPSDEDFAYMRNSVEFAQTGKRFEVPADAIHITPALDMENY